MATATKRATKQSTMVRISEQSHCLLRELAAQGGEPMQSVLDKALEQYRRRRFLEGCDVAYAALQQDPKAWADYQEELAAWDVTSLDGLEPEEQGSVEQGSIEQGSVTAAAGGRHG